MNPVARPRLISFIARAPIGWRQIGWLQIPWLPIPWLPIAWLTAALLTAFPFVVLADRPGPAPERGVASPDGCLVVRVIPAGFSSETSSRATAEYYRLTDDGGFDRYQTAELPHPIAPAWFALSDSGQLVTIDQWGLYGRDEVISVFDPDGKRVAGWKLADLYTPDQLERFPRSVSSVLWRSRIAPQLHGSWLILHDQLGGTVNVDLDRLTASHGDDGCVCDP